MLVYLRKSRMLRLVERAATDSPASSCCWSDAKRAAADA
jgi:hypothetical protein